MGIHTKKRDPWALSGMTIAATSAAVASFTGLRGLATAAGWPDHLAWLLPLTVDAYAMTSTRLWLARHTRHRRARRFAAANAVGAIAGSVAGNAVYHALSAGLLSMTWPIVVAVGSVPAAVLGLIAHLHALHMSTDPAEAQEAGLLADQESEEPEAEPNIADRFEPGTQDRTESEPVPRPRRNSRKRRRYRTEAELIDAARLADQRYRDKHGRPITRDALRAALRISGSRATELRRRLAASTALVPVPDTKEVATH